MDGGIDVQHAITASQMHIRGGYILQPRAIDESDIMKHPPIDRELWFYIIRKVNHADNGKYKRGSGFFSFNDIQSDLEWFVGYRREVYSKPQITKSLRRLCEGNMIATAKATRGILITVCKYDYYQDASNYESNAENTSKKERNHLGGRTKNKNDKNINNEKNIEHNSVLDARKLKFAQTLTPFVAQYGKETIREFYEYWTEPNKSKTKFRQELEKTWDAKRRLDTWVKNDFSKKEKSSGQKEKESKLQNNISVFESALKNYQ